MAHKGYKLTQTGAGVQIDLNKIEDIGLVTQEKEGLMSPEDKVKLDNIEGTIPTSLAELTEDASHRTVTDSEKAGWNAKSDFSGSYRDLTDKPTIPTKTSQLINDSAFVTYATNMLINYYRKSETYSKNEIQELISTIQGISFRSVNSLPPASAATRNIIYLVPSASPQTENIKDEWITIEDNGFYSWERIGSTAIDLDGYVTDDELTAALQGYVTSAAFATALAGKQNVIDSGHKLDYALLSNTPTIPTKVSELTNDAGYITGYTETDPTVPSWAKASSKPSYTAAEVGALPDDTEIPSALSDLSDDSTHRLVTDTEKATWNSKQDAISDLGTIRSGASAGATAYQKPATGIPASDINTADIDGVSIFPDMDSLTPVQTIEYDIANNRWNKLFERANPSGIVASAVAGTVACRLTVTGTGMTDKQVTDLVFILPGKANQTNLFFTYSRTPDTSAPANYGIYMLRGYWAKTLGSGYGWGVDFNVYGSNLPRHLKVEIFKIPDSVSFSSQETAATSSSSYQNFTSNYNLSWFQSFQGMPFDISGQANRALYVSSFLPVSPGSAYHVAGEALAADNLVFQASDSKFYKVSTTNKIINTDASILLTDATASGATIGYAYLRVLSGATAFSSTSATYGSFAKGDEIFLRCTNSNGNIYSDGILTNAVSAGHTWISIGWAVSSTQLALNTAGKVFFTLDANGKLTHINGREIAGGSAGGGEAYWATVGTTPYADVKAAYDSGKPVFAINSSGYAFVLNYANSSSLYFSCLAMDEHKGYYAYVNSNGWTTGNADIYSKPSGGIPASDIASGVIPTVPTISTDISADASSDTKTASPKAVKTYVDGIVGDIETLLSAI